MPVAIHTKPPRPLPASLKRKALVAPQATSQPASSATPVSLLPSAALASIFVSASLDHSSRTYVDPAIVSKRAKTTILSLSHVDPLWRAISLGIPDLWLHLLVAELDADVNEAEYPLYRRKEWLRELFRRSDPLAIDIGAPGYSYLPRDPELVGLELENLHRIRAYRVSLDERGWETLSSCLDESAPVLESVSLAFRPSVFRAASRFESDEGLTPVPQLPKTILNGFAPRLTKLTLRGCLPSAGEFSSPILSNLKSLTVAQVSGPGVPTADRWIAYLSGMPRLEHLALEDGAVTLRRKQKRNSNPKPVVSGATLESLRTLSLEGAVDAVGSILGRLAFPEECSLSVKCSDVEGEGPVDVVLRAFARGFEGVATGEDAVRLLSLKGDQGILHVSDGTRNRRLELYMLDNPHLEPQSVPLWQTLLSRLLSSIPLTISSFTTLEVLLPYVPPALTKSLSGACQLERLVNLTGAMARKLLPLLQKEQHTVCMSPSLSSSNHTFSSFVTSSDSLSALSPLPILPALHTVHFSSLDAFSGEKWDAVRAFVKWRALGWRAIRLVQAPMAGYGMLGDVEEALETLNVSIVYAH